MNPFDQERTTATPYLMGDVFTQGGQELTLLQAGDLYCFGFLNYGGVLRMAKFANLHAMLDQGFTPVEEFIEKSKEMRENYIYAPRKLEDGTWAGLSRLVTTTAIHVNWDDISPFETRYCFSHNQIMPSYHTALFWLAQFKNKNSLPVGNCAYRGRLGNQPLCDENRTKKYYQDMIRLKHEVQFIDGLDMHGVANQTMIELLSDLMAKGVSNV